ncbi:hypothetical protein [Pseudonocardia humida]|uniref:Integral membrane protein n=1 Tax=Pseudonocardia humida TaxID=2800819 RepID=A0ABT1AB81_9PSEU|nr:hypothetical protein [Pseudonocardia humida]MCO1660221.1 hypothetical protein [Pseudonocardia humida]
MPLPGPLASPTEITLSVAGAAVGLVAMLLCLAAALHCLRRDRPMAGLGLLFTGPALLLAAQVVGPVQVAVALAVVVPVGAVARLRASR